MDDTQAGKVLDSMVQFIKNHGQEQAKDIKKQTEQEFTIECEKLIGSEKEKLRKLYDTKLEQEGIKMKIERSKALNKQRITKMAYRNQLIDKSLEASKIEMNTFLSEDQDQYKELLTKLLV